MTCLEEERQTETRADREAKNGVDALSREKPREPASGNTHTEREREKKETKERGRTEQKIRMGGTGLRDAKVQAQRRGELSQSNERNDIGVTNSSTSLNRERREGDERGRRNGNGKEKGKEKNRHNAPPDHHQDPPPPHHPHPHPHPHRRQTLSARYV